ncbi:hypothetical protein HYX16_01450 [Candidatus Woesearchaeota archaeon]|nr:hypothetical protein [Candidatus Woesearchaeota archaeon]
MNAEQRAKIKEEYNRKFDMGMKACILSLFISLCTYAGITYHGIKNLPEQTPAVLNYNDAKTTLANLEEERKSLKRDLNDFLPYRPDKLKEKLEELFPLRSDKERHLDEIIETIKLDVEEMKSKEEVKEYNEKMAESNKTIKNGGLTALGILTSVGLISFVYIKKAEKEMGKKLKLYIGEKLKYKK